MKTKDELNAIKKEVEEMGRKLAELTEDELRQVTGGTFALPDMLKKEGVMTFTPPTNDTIHNFHVYGGPDDKKFVPDFGD